MGRWIVYILVFSLGLSACSAVSDLQPRLAAQEQDPEIADLPDLGNAPELTNDVWLNTARPLRLADLRGKVVLLDMWTFG